MTVRWGRCSNFKNCKDAERQLHIPIPTGAAFICPECKHTLLDEDAENVKIPKTPDAVPEDNSQKAPAKAGKKPFVAVVAVVLILLVGVAGFFLWSRFYSANSASKNLPKTILRLAGSNTIGDTLGPALAEAFLKERGATDVHILPGAKPQEKIVQGFLPGDSQASAITIAAHGSATAFTSLAGNSCEIGMASRKIKADEAAKLTALGDMTAAGSEHILGLDGIAVIVNAANPTDQLSKEQIMKIFTGGITDWSQLGSSHGAIKIYARDDNSGTYDTFKSLVLAGKPLAPGAQRFEDSKALSDAVAADPNGIGFIGLPYIQSAKPIAVSEKGTQSLLPTRLTVATEDYLLSRRLYLYTPATTSNAYMRQFIEFALSKQGQDVVGASGFVAQNVTQVAQAVSEDAPEEYKQLTQDANRLSLDFRFQSGQTVLDNKAKVDLDRVVWLIADLKVTGDKIMLFGFSDSTGSAAANQALSLSRARVVESEFALRGMAPAIVRGFGAGLPVASNDSDDGQAKNRRVEIWIKK
jgi:phosphate transport system substrate-binding protein